MCYRRRSITVLQREENADEELVKVLLQEGREELGRADAKASMLFSAVGIVAAALLAGAIAGKWNPTKVDYDIARWGLWLSIGGGGVGLVLLGLAVLPRTRNLGDKERLAYFGDVVGFREKGLAIRKSTRRAQQERGRMEFRNAVSRVSGSRLDRTLDQVWVVSAIVHKKYGRVRAALFLFALATVSAIASLVLNALRMP